MTGSKFLARRIIEVEQLVADFLTDNAFGPLEAQSLSQTIEGLRGSIQALPVNAAVKFDLLSRLDSIQALLASFITNLSGVTAFQLLTALLALLTLLKQKILALQIKPCEGELTVCVPAPFSTICPCC